MKEYCLKLSLVVRDGPGRAWSKECTVYRIPCRAEDHADIESVFQELLDNVPRRLDNEYAIQALKDMVVQHTMRRFKA